MIRLAIYLAFGFAFLVIFEGPQIDPSNAWTWVWIFGWPIPVALFVGKWLLIVIGVAFAAGCLIAAWESWSDHRSRGGRF